MMIKKNIKIDKDCMELISLFNNISGAIIKDCIIYETSEDFNEVIIFLVKKDDVGKAIGKDGEHVKDLTLKLQKKIDVIPFSKELEIFIKYILNTTKNSIKVNEFYQTKLPNIYAIGDVIGAPWLAHVASHEGIIAVDYINNENPHKLDYSNVPGCTYCQPQVASIGLTEDKAKEEGEDDRHDHQKQSGLPIANDLQQVFECQINHAHGYPLREPPAEDKRTDDKENDAHPQGDGHRQEHVTHAPTRQSQLPTAHGPTLRHKKGDGLESGGQIGKARRKQSASHTGYGEHTAHPRPGLSRALEERHEQHTRPGRDDHQPQHRQ